MKHHLFKFTIFTSCLFLVNTYANALMKGNGTTEDPYQISTCKDLQNMQQNLSANYILTNDIDCADTRNWNSGQGFLPVGSGVHVPQTAFTGNFDGDNYKIFNLYINIPGQNGIGLFGYNSGNIANVGLENVDINTTSLVPGGVIGTGSLVGTNAATGNISNCYSTGVVRGQYITGGLVGVGSGTIKNSYSTANVIVKASTTSSNTFGGGLVGVLRSGNITYSYATGNVEGAESTNATITLGGLVGNSSYAAIINTSFATGTINPRTTGRANSGGLVGMTTGSATIKNSYAIGSVYSGGLDSSYVGGLVGSPAAISNPAILNSYAIGCVAQGQKSSTIGGLVGGSTIRFITNSYYNLDTSCQNTTKNGIGVTDAQMKQQATFTGWDFVNTWAINEGKYYPVLPWDAGKENLYNAQTQLQEFEKQHTEFYKKYGSFQGITYNVSDGNTVSTFQTPNIWGQSLASIGYIPWDGTTSDFSDLPDCTQNQNICPTNTQCLHLNAFNNGITGQDTKRCVSNADKMVDNIYYVMTSANTSIDITTLEPFPDGRFLGAIRNAITWLAVNNRNVTVRVAGGVPLNYYGNQNIPDEILQQQARANDNQFLQQLVQDIPPDKSNNVSVYVGSMRTCAGVGSCVPANLSRLPWRTIAYRFSWNHSKIIDADGKLSLVGGENWWTNSYLVNNPVNDVNLEVNGPASLDASNFVNQLWNFICRGGNKAVKTLAISASWINGQYGTSCLSTIPLPTETLPKENGDSATIMAIGRLGAGMFKGDVYFKADEPANQSEIVRNLLFKGAVRTVRIAQQNTQGLVVIPHIGYNYTPAQFERDNDAGNVYDILTNLLLESADVYIVETNYGAVDGAGEAYYVQSKLTDVADTYLNRAKALRPNLSGDVINSLLCQHLHLADIRYSSDTVWPDQQPIGNHSKVWIVDDNAYYVGSHNIYPANLQEYGYIVGGTLPTQSFVQQFWTPLWQYSQKSEISGSEIPSSACYYNTPDSMTSFTCAERSMIEQSPLEIGYKGCQLNGNKDQPLKFVKSTTTNMNSHPDAFVCTNYTSGQNRDIWTGCGRGQPGKDDYQIGVTGTSTQKVTVLNLLKSWEKNLGL